MRSLGLFRIVNGLLCALFLVGAVVQLNDPDPALWVAMYTTAAVACALAPRHSHARFLSLAVGVVALAWAGWLLYQTGGDVGLGELFEPMESSGGRVELMREGLGLLIIAAWMGVLVRHGFRRAAGAATVER